jgi:hypothetical protein
MELRQVSGTFQTSGDSGRQGPQEAENCVLVNRQVQYSPLNYDDTSPNFLNLYIHGV